MLTDRGVNPSGDVGDTSSTLLVRLKARNADAWARFVRLYTPLVYRWCRRAGLQEADIADVSQEVFRAVAGAIVTLHHDREGDSFRGWLRTITRNKVHDFARRKPVGADGPGGSDAHAVLHQICDPVGADPDGGTEPDDQLLVYRQAIELVLGEVNEVVRQAFLRVVVGGQHPADVAKDLQISVNSVYLAKSRLLRRLREEFAGLL